MDVQMGYDQLRLTPGAWLDLLATRCGLLEDRFPRIGFRQKIFITSNGLLVALGLARSNALGLIRSSNASSAKTIN